jgi:hypothetical protein
MGKRKAVAWDEGIAPAAVAGAVDTKSQKKTKKPKKLACTASRLTVQSKITQSAGPAAMDLLVEFFKRCSQVGFCIGAA